MIKYVGETVFDNLDGTCMCPFDYLEEHEKHEYRNNPPFIVQENRIDDDTVYCSNEHLHDENPNPKEWKYSEGFVLVGLWHVKYKQN